jgi:hypothetical protein
MWLRLRQIALVAARLAPVERTFTDVLGLQVCYRDPGVAKFGLENALMPIGNQLLEVVAPVRDDTAAGRYLARRGGDGGYMVITQCDEHAPRRARVEALGIRVVNQFETHQFRNMQLHPKDTGGSFFEIDEQVGDDAHEPDGPWEPAGPYWQSRGTAHLGSPASPQPRSSATIPVRWPPAGPRSPSCPYATGRRPSRDRAGERRAALRALPRRPSRGPWRHRRGGGRCGRRARSGAHSRRAGQRPPGDDLRHAHQPDLISCPSDSGASP